MNCRQASIQISLHVGDDLPAADVPALEAHLEHCALCEAEYESYASARDALFLLKEEMTEEFHLWDEVEAALEQSQTRARPWYRRPFFAAGLAAALMLAVWPLWKAPKNPQTDLVTHSVLQTSSSPAVATQVQTVGAQTPWAARALTPESELVPTQEVLDFLNRSQGKGLLLQDSNYHQSLIAVPVSNPTRRAY